MFHVEKGLKFEEIEQPVLKENGGEPFCLRTYRVHSLKGLLKYNDQITQFHIPNYKSEGCVR